MKKVRELVKVFNELNIIIEDAATRLLKTAFALWALWAVLKIHLKF